MSLAAQTLSALTSLAVYRAAVLPAARRELGRWQARAAQMPAGALREAALAALTEKRANPEATAVFAILAPRRCRGRALRAIVALQVAIDYLDCLGEREGDDPLAEGLALHGALLDAVSPGPDHGHWYRYQPHFEDGGYLAALVAACRTELAALPAIEPVRLALERAARRCGEGQSHTHAVAATGSEELREWAAQLMPAGNGFLWWEVAAGASSSVAAHALIAAAADPATGREVAELIDAAYFPPIGALTVLLDDLVDREADLAAAEHNYLSYCECAGQAADRIGLLAARARSALAALPGKRRHGAILAGVAGFYLGAAGRDDHYARPIRKRLLEELGPSVRAILVERGLGRRG